MKNVKHARRVRTIKIQQQPQLKAASATSVAPTYTPPPEMVRIDNLGVARIHWSDATVWLHDGSLYIQANGIKIVVTKQWKLP